jgi:hypothetical protein
VVLHPALERLNPAFFLVVQSAMNSFVETARVKVGPNASVDRMRVIAIKPQVQFVQLLGRKRVYGVFDFLDRS